MAIIPAVQSLTSRAIDRACEAVLSEDRERSATLRCSSIGDPCDRRLWYALRWAHEEEKHEGRVLRIFDNGHSREARLIEFLRAAGIVVHDRDPATGNQWRVSLANGALTGSCDGIVENVPEAPKTRHLLEIKTMKESRYRAWRRQGVRVSDPRYWVQMQCYMHGLGLTRALFLVENQDTREIEVERIEYDAGNALVIEARAARIFASEMPPARLSDDPGWYQCRFCPASKICHGGEWVLRNCRTCYAASSLQAEPFHCGRTEAPLSLAEQAVGCGAHLYFPSLVEGEVVSADHERGVITYKLANGFEFVDGGSEAAARSE